MKTKPAAAPAARGTSASDAVVHVARKPLPGRAPAPSSSPGIVDAVMDQHGGRWIRYGSGDHSVWFNAADLISAGTEVFKRLSRVGVLCITRPSQDGIKREVEAHATYRAALVASRPGWLDGHYVFGDGSVIAPHGDEREVIIAFEGDPKFRPQGSLSDWQASIGPLVTDQPLALFSLAFAFVGPLLRFAPAGYTNPLVELVGPRECGKSTLGVLAASVWAGNPDSGTGGGESWDLTLNALDDQKRRHRDNFLLQDEGNLAGASARERKEFFPQAVFKLAGTGEKRRFGDEGVLDQTRLAMLSTTNTPIRDLVEGSEDVRGALHSRIVTLQIRKDRPYGVLASGLPVLHIVDATAEAIRGAGRSRPLLLATRFTMEQPFYRDRLRDRHGIEALVPEEQDRETVHRIIYDELCQGVVRPESKAAYLDAIRRSQGEAGVDGIILGCTEITLLIGKEDVNLPVFDSTRLHAEAAMAFALGVDATLRAAE